MVVTARLIYPINLQKNSTISEAVLLFGHPIRREIGNSNTGTKLFEEKIRY